MERVIGVDGQVIGLRTAMLKLTQMGMILNKMMVSLNVQHATAHSQPSSVVWFMKGLAFNNPMYDVHLETHGLIYPNEPCD